MVKALLTIMLSILVVGIEAQSKFDEMMVLPLNEEKSNNQTHVINVSPTRRILISGNHNFVFNFYSKK